MKVFVVLVVALACVSAASIPETPVAIKDIKSPKVVEGRIINGHEAHPAQITYQAGVSIDTAIASYWCGGSIISHEWILSAAHCFVGAESATVYLGSTVRTVYKTSHTVTSRSIFPHSEFNPYTFANDVCVVNIPYTPYSDYIQPIRLPAISEADQNYYGEYAIASGWGKDNDKETQLRYLQQIYGASLESGNYMGAMANYVLNTVIKNSGITWNLNYAYLYVIPNKECADYYGDVVITKEIICTSDSSTYDGSTTCQGDSGGPLVLNNTLIGIVSFGSAAGCEAGPAGFTRVSSHLGWINDNTGVSY